MLLLLQITLLPCSVSKSNRLIDSQSDLWWSVTSVGHWEFRRRGRQCINLPREGILKTKFVPVGLLSWYWSYFPASLCMWQLLVAKHRNCYCRLSELGCLPLKGKGFVGWTVQWPAGRRLDFL